MTKEELIKYHEDSLECLKNMENSTCDYNCDNCHINNGISLFEIIQETIRHLKNLN